MSVIKQEALALKKEGCVPQLTRDAHRETALAANLRCLESLSAAHNALDHALRGLAADLNCEGAAGHMLVSIAHIHQVGARLGGAVGHSTGAVAVVGALNLRLAWALNREAQCRVA